MSNTSENKVTTFQDWRNDKSVAKCLEHMFRSNLWHDITFTFPDSDGDVVHGHRVILSSRSSVFEAMFFGPLASKQDSIEIQDIEPKIFEHIIGYIYSDVCDLSGDNALPILYGARKYCIEGLVKACSSFLEKNLSSDNVCLVYEQAKVLDIKDLEQKCFTFMVNHSSAVSLSKQSTCLTYESLTHFLSSDQLNGAEIDHFRLLNAWAEQKCVSKKITPTPKNKRKVLGDTVMSIYYPKIKADDFAKVVVPTQLLGKDEQIQLLQYAITSDKKYLEDFSFTPRKKATIRLDVSKLQLGTVAYPSGFNALMFEFSVNTHCRLYYVGPLKIQGSDEFCLNDIVKIDCTNKSDYNRSICTPNLDKNSFSRKLWELEFKPNKNYVVQFRLKSNVRYSSQVLRRGKAEVTNGHFTCSIQTIPSCVTTMLFVPIR